MALKALREFKDPLVLLALKVFKVFKEFKA